METIVKKTVSKNPKIGIIFSISYVFKLYNWIIILTIVDIEKKRNEVIVFVFFDSKFIYHRIVHHKYRIEVFNNILYLVMFCFI